MRETDSVYSTLDPRYLGLLSFATSGNIIPSARPGRISCRAGPIRRRGFPILATSFAKLTDAARPTRSGCSKSSFSRIPHAHPSTSKFGQRTVAATIEHHLLSLRSRIRLSWPTACPSLTAVLAGLAAGEVITVSLKMLSATVLVGADFRNQMASRQTHHAARSEAAWLAISAA